MIILIYAAVVRLEEESRAAAAVAQWDYDPAVCTVDEERLNPRCLTNIGH